MHNQLQYAAESDINFKEVGRAILDSAVTFGLTKLEEYLTKDHSSSNTNKKLMYHLVDNSIPYDIYKRNQYDAMMGNHTKKDKSIFDTVVDVINTIIN